MPRRLWLLAVLVAPFCGCASARPSVSPQGPVALRELQSRVYPNADPKALMKAVLGALQDGGFQVRNADSQLGLITATRESVIPVTPAAKAGRFLLIAVTYGAAVLLPGPKSSSAIVEATVNVSDAGEEARLRVSFQLKVLDGGSRVKEVRPVDDPRFYQDFFAKVDKGLFLLREKLSAMWSGNTGA